MKGGLLRFSNSLSSRGSTLIELLMATTIAAVVLTAISTSMIYSFKNAAQARHRDTATNLAQEMVEFFRLQRAAKGWGGFVAALDEAETYCITGDIDESTELSDFSRSACPGAESIAGASYSRDVVLFYPDSGTVRLVVTVSWQVGDEEWQEVTLEQIFKRWD